MKPLPDTWEWYAKKPGRAMEEEVAWIMDGGYRRDAAFVAKHMKERDLKTVLELGCGSGLFAAALRELVPGINYEGVDRCREFLEMAQRRCLPLRFCLDDFRTHECDPFPADVAVAWNVWKNVGLHEWDAVVSRFLSQGRHTAFSAQTIPRVDLDNGREYHHVYVTRIHLERVIAEAGHEVVESVVRSSAEVEGHGKMEDLAVWTRKVVGRE